APPSVSRPGRSGRTITRNDALAPGARSARLHCSTAPDAQANAPGRTAITSAAASSASVRSTLVAGPGPWLTTVIVSVIVAPRLSCDVLSWSWTARSAGGAPGAGIGAVAISLSLAGVGSN